MTKKCQGLQLSALAVQHHLHSTVYLQLIPNLSVKSALFVCVVMMMNDAEE